MSYDIREIRLDHALSLCVKSWKERNARFPEHTIHCDPDWIAEHFKHSGSTVSDLEQLDFAAPWVYPRATNKENVPVVFTRDSFPAGKPTSVIVRLTHSGSKEAAGAGDSNAIPCSRSHPR